MRTVIPDEYNDPPLVYQWDLVEGFPQCVLESLPVNDPAAQAARDKNKAVRDMIAAVEDYEAAQAVVAAAEAAGVENDESAAARDVLAATTLVTKALAEWRAGASGDDEAARDQWARARSATLAALQAAIEANRLAGFPAAKIEAKAAVAAYRWQAETGGATIGGLKIPTDEKSQGKFTAAALAAMLDPAYSVNWKLSDGSFVTLYHAQILGLAQGARAHVQSCFDREAQLVAAIDAATTPAELAAINIGGGWPS